MSKRLFIGCSIGLLLLPLNQSNVILSDSKIVSNFSEKTSSTLDCQNEQVSIYSSNRNISLIGACKGVDIFGWNNTIQAQNLSAIEVFGGRNRVQAQNIKRIELFGSNNQISSTSAHYIEIFGSSNQVKSQIIQSIELFGASNSVHYQKTAQPNKALHHEHFGTNNRIEKIKIVLNTLDK